MSTSLEHPAIPGGQHPGREFQEWWPTFWFGSLLVVSFAVVLGRLAKLWMTDADLSHGAFVPLLAGYIVWQRRARLLAVQPVHSLFGLFLMALGAVLLCIGPPSLDTFAALTRSAFMLSLVGTILYLRGFATLRMLFYPLALLLLMFPVPGFILSALTFPLQIVASKLAEHILELLGYSVLREGNILMLPGLTLNIAEACNGLRSLLALTFLGQAYTYMFDTRVWMRFVMAVLIIPIGVFANSIRIVASAVAGSINPEWAHGTFHESTGWIVFVVAFICILCAHWAINQICRVAANRKDSR
jgi:exosortase